MKNFVLVSETEGFLEISQQALCRYLSSDVLKTDMKEISVYKAAKNWILKNSIKDATLISEIMSNVRFAFIPAMILSGQILLDELIDGNRPFRTMVAEAMKYHVDVYCQPFYTGNINKPRGKPGMLVIPNGPRQADSYNTNNNGQIDFLPLPTFAPATNSTSLNLPIVYDSMCVVQINNFLFLFGCTSDRYQNFTMRYDASNDTWMKMEPVPQEATVGSKVACSEDKKKAVLIGGMTVNATMKFKVSPESVIASTYIYDIQKNAWSPGSDLPQTLAHHAVATHGDIIYVSGGYSEHELLDTVYAYDVKAKLWLTKARMNVKRCQHTFDAVGEKLYAIGGRVFGGNRPASFEIYDTLSNQWTLSEFEEDPFVGVFSLVKDNIIYIIGGFHKNRMIRVFEVDKNEITELDVELPSHCGRNVSAFLTLPKLL